MNTVIIGIGSNIDAESNVGVVRKILGETLRVLNESRFVKTKPIGTRDQENFLNGSVLAQTNLGRENLKALLKKVEASLGRGEKEDPYGPRTMDLDILVWNGEIIDLDVYKRDFLRHSIIELCPELEKTIEKGSNAT